LKRALSRVGIRITRSSSFRNSLSVSENREYAYSDVFPSASYSPWLSDREFQRILRIVADQTLIDPYRLWELWTLARYAESLEGDVLEVGVWRGGSAGVLGSRIKSTNKKLWLADTFAGVPKAGLLDNAYRGGEHADTDVEVVSRNLEALGISNFEIIKGVFPDETGTRIRGPLSLVHVDVDVYQSAKDVFETALPILCVGGVFVFDDYGFSECRGVTRFVNELRDAAGLLTIHNLNGHAVIVKTR